MDYLLSLVEQDQYTVVEAIKDLAEKADKVNPQEKEINELNNKLEDNREEIHYFRIKVE